MQVVRDVDITGRFFVAVTNLKLYNNFIIANKLQFLPSTHKENCAPSDFSWTSPQEWAQLLLDPIPRLLGQHTTLGVVVGDHLTYKPKFLRLESVDLLRLISVVPIKTHSEIGSVLEKEHNVVFDLSNQVDPLWRLVIAPIADEPSSFYLVLVLHHVVFDGRSGESFSEQLIEQLNLQAKRVDSTAIVNSESVTKISITSNKPMPAPLEERIVCKPSLKTLVSQIVQSLLVPTWVKKALNSQYWAGEMEALPGQPIEIEMKLIQLTYQETSKLIQASKRRSSTVQSILYTASIFAIKAVFMSGHENAKDSILFSTPICLRDMAPTPISHADHGNYVSRILHPNIHIHDESEFWDLAHEYKRQVIERANLEGIKGSLELFGMGEYLPKTDGAYEKLLVSQMSALPYGRESSVGISNLGRGWSQFKGAPTNGGFAKNDEFLVKDGIFSIASMVADTAMGIAVVTVADGVMSISVSWHKSALKGRARGELFAKEFKKILHEAIEDEREVYLFRDAKQTCAI
ncbi:hypothetical protein BGZ79_002129 [Entomortierella chlamydospora]|nr:hypothetical protein BGZ79_002129 [Entomortierella chlamydospora]